MSISSIKMRWNTINVIIKKYNGPKIGDSNCSMKNVGFRKILYSNFIIITKDIVANLNCKLNVTNRELCIKDYFTRTIEDGIPYKMKADRLYELANHCYIYQIRISEIFKSTNTKHNSSCN